MEVATDLINVAHDCIKAFNKADWDEMKKFVAPTAVYIEPATDQRIEGLVDMVEHLKVWKTAFPDLTGELTNVFAVDNVVFLEVLWKGKHTGKLITPFGEFDATFKPYKSRAAMVLEFDRKLIKANRHYFDLLSIFEQLGIHITEKVATATL